MITRSPSPEVESMRRDRSALVAMITRAGSKMHGASCTCPSPDHDDRNPSASIFTDPAGVVRVKCHSCGWSGDIFDLTALVEGRSLSDVLREAAGRPERRPSPVSDAPEAAEPTEARRKPSGGSGGKHPDVESIKARVPHCTEVYQYRRADGGIYCLVVRSDPQGEPKKISQMVPDPEGGFRSGGPGSGPHPLFNLERIADADEVVIVEGEACAGILQRHGIVAVTSLGGAGKAHLTDWSPLAGKSVVVWPDHDAPGEKHGSAIIKILETLDPVPTISLLDPGLLHVPAKGDVVDYIDRLSVETDAQVAKALRETLKLAKPIGPSSGVVGILEDAISGRRKCIDMPWPAIGGLSKALLPGSICLLAAPPGASKSFMLMEAGMHWHQAGIPVALLELEDGRSYHLRRALAQRTGLSGLTDDGWCKDHPEKVRQAYDDHRAWLDSFGRCIFEYPGDGHPDYRGVLAWITHQAESGKRIIAVDPLTICKTDARPWEADQDFMVQAKAIIEGSASSLVLVLHPRKGATDRGVDDLSGGASFGRLAHTVLFLEALPEPRSVAIRDRLSGIKTGQEINRIVHLAKTRNGKGAGLRIGCTFDPETLRLIEHGIILKKESSR
ncbi:MAG: hypothetical protein JJU36_07920 [Phycisphaeraceae bacterium]|nr:hypothetical protein [Phycisphaeraceae bacterium]